MKTEKSCGVVILCNEEYLVLKHDAGHWDFPKGHVEEGESEIETAKREVLEETGIKVRLFEGFREETTYYPKEGILKTVVWFVGFTESKKVKQGKGEIFDYKWLKYGDALKQLTFKNAKELLTKASEFIINK
ncbi:MAG: NUDIX domain-containing protein [Nanoarchaeota archaeon]